MAFTGEYKCSHCGVIEDRKLLMAKKVVFQDIGVGARTHRSRVVAWLCPQCVAKDEDWRRIAYDSPGLAAKN